MSDFSKRLDNLSSDKKELLKMFLQKEGLNPTVQDHYQAPRNPIERKLAEIWMSVLGLEKVGIHDNFFEIGGDSIQGIQVIAKANEAGLSLTNNQLFELLTIARLGEVVEEIDPDKSDFDPVVGPVPLMPIQHWFMELDLPDPHHWNQAFLLTTPVGLGQTLLDEAVTALMNHHDMLRASFHRNDRKVTQIIEEPDRPSGLVCHDLSNIAPETRAETILDMSREVQQSLILWDGPVFRVVFFDFGAAESGRLLIVAHQMILDDYSCRILLEDLETACTQLQKGENVQLPPKTTSYKDWSESLSAGVKAPIMQDTRAYWAQHNDYVALPLDAGVEGDIAKIGCSLTQEETQKLIRDLLPARHTRIHEVALAALANALVSLTGSRQQSIMVRGHGRESWDGSQNVFRTVGWFQTLYPLVLSLPEDDNKLLATVQEALREIPHHGTSYGALRYLCEEAPEGGSSIPDICFDFMGHHDPNDFGKTFARAPEAIGAARALHTPRPFALDVSGWIEDGCLRYSWRFAEGQSQKIEKLASECLNTLRKQLQKIN